MEDFPTLYSFMIFTKGWTYVLMGVALVGGMLFATLLGIFVYPALYYFVGKIGRFEQRRELKKQEENA